MGYDNYGVKPPIQVLRQYVNAADRQIGREKFYLHLQQKVTIPKSYSLKIDKGSKHKRAELKHEVLLNSRTSTQSGIAKFPLEKSSEFSFFLKTNSQSRK
ncbi:hypothetical protein BCD67_14545 [Oscillatoriales cyanobacterium USR001]|nr:hypothetical protein BCD67_14545 [Oscillatoriales cyanobacterium USR001]